METKNLSNNFIYGLYTCRLLSSVLNGTEPVSMPEGMALKALFDFQMRHDVACMAYVALKKLNFSDEELKDFSDEYKLNMLREI